MKKKHSLFFACFLTSIALSTEGNSEKPSENSASQQVFPKIFSPKGTALGNPLKELRRMGENFQESDADPITGAFTPPYEKSSHFGENVAEAWETTQKKFKEFFVGTTKKPEEKDGSKKPVAMP